MDKPYNGQVSFSKASDEELGRMVWRGRMVADLRQNEFYKSHLTKAMQAEVEDIRAKLEWGPSRTDSKVEAIAMDRVWLSGMLQGMKSLQRVMAVMVYEAEQAQKELSKRQEKV